MLFNSLHYLVYFPIVAALYFAIPRSFQVLLVLVASFYFYMCWRWEYALMLIFITGIDYWAALEMVKHPVGSRRRKLPLYLSIAGNMGLLFFFKYWNFFNETAASLAQLVGGHYPQVSLEVLLPVGISFHTFQSVSYAVDVYRGKIEPERDLGVFSLFVAYFPQLVAGPIERGAHILPQLRAHHTFDYSACVAGLQLALWGFFKKVVIADRLAPVVNTVYATPESFEPMQLLIATIFFAFQIYCDFSGYSDIAVGSAGILGVNLMTNFERPYLARSIGEFWRRWHISLSTWFRDYVYIPLGGSRASRARWYCNLMTTFVASGLWHGASWTFLIWGGLNGLYLIAELLLARAFERLNLGGRLAQWPTLLALVGRLWTFGLVSISWVFFRAETVSDAASIFSSLPHGAWSLLVSTITIDYVSLYGSFRGLGLGQTDFVLALCSVVVLLCVELWQERCGGIRKQLARAPRFVRWALYYAIVVSILLFGAFNTSQVFIYFQF